MPGPPTPLSGCHLQQLTIYQDSSVKVYDSTKLANPLTLSLEAQRSINAENHSLMFQVHCGLQRVLSLKLMELLKSSYGKDESISIDEGSTKLCINIRDQNQTFLAEFEAARGFNIAVCMLKKFGFHIKNEIPFLATSSSPSRLASPIYDGPPGNSFGPRLSSITPIPGFGWEGGPTPQQDLSFMTMLNSDSSLSQSNNFAHNINPTPQMVHPQFSHSPTLQGHIMPLTQSASQPLLSSTQINPYNMFTGRQGSYFHQPYISSPLRNAVGADYSRAPSPPNMHRVASFSQPLNVSISNPRSISAPLSGPVSQPVLEAMSWTSADPPINQSPVIQHASASPAQSKDTSSEQHQAQPLNDYRNLMPQPRNLPFALEEKIPADTSKSKTVRRKPKLSTQSRGKSSPATKESPAEPPKQGRKKGVSEGAKGKKINTPAKKEPQRRQPTRSKNNRPPKTPVRESNPRQPPAKLKKANATSLQTELQPQTPEPDPLAFESLGENPTYPETFDTAMLVADAVLLQNVNATTSKLLDQYEVDLARGCQAASRAQFYADQIQQTRRDFWLSQLLEIERGGGGLVTV